MAYGSAVRPGKFSLAHTPKLHNFRGTFGQQISLIALFFVTTYSTAGGFPTDPSHVPTNIRAPEDFLYSIYKIAAHGDLRDVKFVEKVFDTKFSFVEVKFSNAEKSSLDKPGRDPRGDRTVAAIGNQFITSESFFRDHPNPFQVMTTFYRFMANGTYDFGYGGEIQTLGELEFNDVEEYRCLMWQNISHAFGASPRMLRDDPQISHGNAQNKEMLDGLYAFPVAQTPEYVTEVIVSGPIRQPGCAWNITIWQHKPY